MSANRHASSVVLAALLVAGCGPGGSVRSLGVPQTNEAESERFRPRVDAAVVYPPAPQSARLVPFRVSNPAAAYFVDRDSVAVLEDGTIRATIVGRFAGARDAVSYEGFRCGPRERRVFGYAREGGAWVDARPSEWRPVSRVADGDYVSVLYREYFCPSGLAVRSTREAVDALVRGGHPELGARP